ncbi:MAG: hypothetical protein HY850_08140 [Betaproteobacteria bacterium]|nr:hypothetical protein [Betaproteobacteria bacterium]
MNEMAALGTSRCFLTYTGVKLPFKLVTPLSDGEVENRNTYFRGYFDADERLLGFDKMVYGEIEMAHRYAYHPNGALKQVEVADIDGDLTRLDFDAQGEPA